MSSNELLADGWDPVGKPSVKRGAAIKIRCRWRTDWFRVVVDLNYAGMSMDAVAESIDVPQATLRGWKQGAEPSHRCGHALLELWCEVMGRAMSDRPMTQD